ncbi:MAG TPA: FxsA family protein [Mycobacteriales bacterium]|nr:FxsA family protein [Mycobacteriales bacterium]
MIGILLVLAFIIVPIVELYVIVQVGQAVGVLPTIGLLLAVALLGSWLVKREGLRAWRSFLAAMQERRVPAREVADGALVVLGGAMLLTPGFVTDVLGLVLILPPTRAVLRRALTGVVARRLGGTAVRRLR